MADGHKVTRLAPSPTGGLHLGNARTFFLNWALARQRGWRIAFRIDDLDSPRVKPGADAQAIEDLKWLGLDWDTDPIYQTQLIDQYETALVKLASAGLIYPCDCTRTQIAARSASAPNEGDHELRYSGHCRPEVPCPFDFAKLKSTGVAWRLRINDDPTILNDQICGNQSIFVAREVGDFLVANKQGTASYQLAVNIDDHVQGVTEIVRGDDLLTSAARQILVRRALGLATNMNYWHLPLVVGSDGMRLAKRHGDTRLAQYRRHSVQPERIIGLIASWSGNDRREAMTVADFLAWFDIDKLPKTRIVFSVDDHQWLLRS